MSRPWVALIDDGGNLLYVNEAHYRWYDHIMQSECSHPAIEANGDIRCVTCDDCRDDYRKMCLDQLEKASVALQHG